VARKQSRKYSFYWCGVRTAYVQHFDSFLFPTYHWSGFQIWLVIQKQNIESIQTQFKMKSSLYFTLSAAVAIFVSGVELKSDPGSETTVVLFEDGLTAQGNARVHTTSSYNLLGGSVSMTVNASLVQDGIVATVYVISPDIETKDYYCDINTNPACMELDFMELNGRYTMQTTYHTTANGLTSSKFPCSNGECVCDQAGCFGVTQFDNTWYKENGCINNAGDATSIDTAQPFQLTAKISESGEMSVEVSQGDNTVNTMQTLDKQPSSTDFSQVQSIMKANGAVVVISLWEGGWAPGNCGSETTGSLSDSIFTISNIQVDGPVICSDCY